MRTNDTLILLITIFSCATGVSHIIVTQTKSKPRSSNIVNRLLNTVNLELKEPQLKTVTQKDGVVAKLILGRSWPKLKYYVAVLLPWMLAFAGCAILAYQSSSSDYWPSLEGLLVASVAAFNPGSGASVGYDSDDDIYQHTSLIIIASLTTLENTSASYFGVRNITN